MLMIKAEPKSVKNFLFLFFYVFSAEAIMTSVRDDLPHMDGNHIFKLRGNEDASEACEMKIILVLWLIEVLFSSVIFVKKGCCKQMRNCVALSEDSKDLYHPVNHSGSLDLSDAMKVINTLDIKV